MVMRNEHRSRASATSGLSLMPRSPTHDHARGAKVRHLIVLRRRLAPCRAPPAMMKPKEPRTAGRPDRRSNRLGGRLMIRTTRRTLLLGGAGVVAMPWVSRAQQL